MRSYIAYNGAMVTTAAFVPVTTGTVIKTMLQIKAPAASPIYVWKWGIDFDGVGTVPIKCELVDTVAIGATVTAHLAAGVQPYGSIQQPSDVQLGVTATGHSASAEGSIVATRYGDIHQVLPGNGDRNEWSLGREFFVPAGNILRVRVTTATAYNCTAFVIWDE